MPQTFDEGANIGNYEKKSDKKDKDAEENIKSGSQFDLSVLFIWTIFLAIVCHV
ncbi:MAG: hypothetical protein ACOX3Q_01060 [Clostridia bacterium]